jgi:hypothetical protein
MLGVRNNIGTYPAKSSLTKPETSPFSLTCVVVSHEEIYLEWRESIGNEEGFSIERTDIAGGLSGWSEIDTVIANVKEYLDNTCLQQTTYYYRVRAFIGVEYSEYTNIVSGTTPLVTLPANTDTEYVVGDVSTDLGILIVYSATRGTLKQVGEINIISGYLDEVKSDPLNTFSFDDVGLTVTAHLIDGNITAVLLVVDNSSVDPIIFNSTIEIIRGTKALMGMPDPDYLFDTRSNLTLIDKIKGEQFKISHFPHAYLTSSGIYSSWWKSNVNNVPTESWTYAFVFKASTNSTNVTINNLNGNVLNYAMIYKYSDNSVLLDTFMNGVRTQAYGLISILPWSDLLNDFKLFIISWDNETQTFKRAYETQIETYNPGASVPAEGSTSQVDVAKVALPFELCSVMKFSRSFTNQEITDFASGIVPSDSLAFMNLLNNDNRAFDQLVDNEMFVIDPISGLPCYFTNAGDGDDHVWELKNNNQIHAPYNLFHGFTQRQTFQVPYSSAGIKLLANDSLGYDVECPADNVIHNLAASYINCNPNNMPMDYSDDRYKIYAIWNKADRTIWKSSIETANEGVHYIADENGNYTLWNPLDELNQEFIDLHAETGHDGHIFVGLRTSGVNITGITQIAVYKNNLT